ncbi:MAG: hypothetical protein R3B84_18695 [Zavarzinella sp.]
MSQHITHPVFDGFVTLWVFNPQKQFPLRNKELLVYSALAHADRREWKPTNTKLAWSTGLNRNSIPQLLKNLYSEGLVLEDRSPVNRPEYFFTADPKKQVEHWSQQLRFWKCLVRNQGSTMLVTDQCVLSYIWYGQVTSFEPPKGWSVPYLAHILKLGKRTVRDAIARLEKMCLLKVSGSQWAVPEHLKLLQEEWFIRKSEEYTVKEKITLGTFEPDMRELDEGYAPGGIPGMSEPAKSWRPVDSAAVHRHIGQLLNERRCSITERYRILDAAMPELRQAGTEGDEWKAIVKRHVHEWIASQGEPTTSPEMSDEDLLKELEFASLEE